MDLPTGTFYQRAIELVRHIPPGRVATYGQIAAILDSPRAARMVGTALKHAADTTIPWQRVVNRHGIITIEHMVVTKDEQARRLRHEGVEVTDQDGILRVDLGRYLVSTQELTHDLA